MNNLIRWCIVCCSTTVLLYVGVKKYSTSSKMNEARVIIDKVEDYKQATGFYPESLRDVGVNFDEKGPFYYQKEKDGKCILWFGELLGESKVYCFEKKEWE